MMNPPGRQKDIYFFAQDEEFAQYYDIVEGLINPHLAMVTDLMTELVVQSINAAGRGSNRAGPCILVIGSGTGGEILPVARRLQGARFAAIDFSKPMNEQLRKKYAMEFGETELASNLLVLDADFLSAECAPARLLNLSKDRLQTDRFDVAVMGFVTHHYSTEDKMEFYRRIRSVLRKGGSLIHADLFSYRSTWLSRLAHEIGEEWTRKQLTEPDVELLPRFEKIRPAAARIRDAWIDHWNNTHVYSPLASEADHSLGAGGDASHVRMLREVGFSEIECPLRLWEMGVVWARL